MAKNKINDLRDHLFAALEALRDPDKPMELDRARAISEVAQTIINSAKVEVDLLKAVGESPASAFFKSGEQGLPSANGPRPQSLDAPFGTRRDRSGS